MSSKSRNVFTPFLRRFTDERAQDVYYTSRLQKEVLERWQASVWSKPQARLLLAKLCFDRLEEVRPIQMHLQKPFKDAITDILDRETPIFDTPGLKRPIESLPLQERVGFRRALRSQQYFLANEERVADLLVDGIVATLSVIVLSLPEIAGANSATTVSLFDVLGDQAPDMVERIVSSVVADEFLQTGLFFSLQQRLYLNLCRVNNAEPFADHGQLKNASELKLPPREVVEALLVGTPYAELFQIRLPWKIPDAVRSTHVLMVAPTGSGKTQWIQQDIFDQLQRPDPPGMVVIDSQNQMIPKLERLQIARDRIIIVDPFDDPPPALNMFVAHKRNLSQNAREIAEAQTLEQFAWVFSALDQDLSGRMKTLFSFTVRILMKMAPLSNMRTMLEFLRIERPSQLRASPFWPYIERSDEDTHYFFNERFCTGDYNRTKAGVADRLLGVLRIPAFARMFTANDNKLDMYSELAARKLIVFNTHKRGLQSEASAVLGRYAIALYVKSAFEREDDANPPPAFLYVDEASEYFGKKDSSDTLFTQLRKFEAGTFVAFQETTQMGDQTKILMANTDTKIAARIGPGDAGNLAPAMRTRPSVLDTAKEPNRFNMACYVKDHTPHALTFSFPYGVVENASKLSDAEHSALRAENRRKFGATAPTQEEPLSAATAPSASSPAKGGAGSKEMLASSFPPVHEAPLRDDTRHTKPVKE